MDATYAAPMRARAVTARSIALLRSLLLVASAMVAAAPPLAATGLQQAARFADTTPLADSTELARRLLTPLSFQRLQRYLAAHAGTMRTQPLDPAQEKFAVHVPAGAPPAEGYGLLVFVPPWPQAALPQGWTQALDRHGLIFVSAANSGNAADVMDRRVPLALLAWANIRGRYPLDPARVYVGGFSGGSRVALRIALAYPDVFRGVLLEAGSDPIGEPPVSLPPADLFRRFQQDTRLVYLTGGQDEAHLRMDVTSRQSMQEWCVAGGETVAMPWRGHEIAEPAALGHALDALARPAAADAGKLAACRARNDRALSSRLAEVAATLAHGARAQLDAIDSRYGGLAAAALLEWAARLDAKP
ncbi:UNVERIFIED_ORG: hypothetical protein RHOFW104R5_29520 [Rhodanobacter sp. FW104-R5]